MDASFIDITIIIPNWNGERWLPGCLDALKQQTYQKFRTLVVDNGSRDGSLALLQNTYPWVDSILLPDNQGFAAAVNAGIRTVQTEYIVLLNNDTIPARDWLFHLHAAITVASPDVGFLASCMVKMDNPHYIDDAGDILSWYGSATKRGHDDRKGQYLREEDVFSACAGAALYRHSALLQVGLFDEKFNSYLEDVDLGLRLRLAGYRCVYIPKAVIMHKGHGSGIPREKYIIHMTRNRLLLFLKNIPILLLVKHLHHIIAGQIWYGVAYRNIFASCAGYASFLSMFPSVIREHRKNEKIRKLSAEQVQVLLTLNKP